jgi:hypothetical protein
MVTKKYAPDENAPRRPYADKDTGVGMGRINLDDTDDEDDDLDDDLTGEEGEPGDDEPGDKK